MAGGKDPPKRPDEVTKLTSLTEDTGDLQPPSADPTMDLFNAIQAARERQSSTHSQGSSQNQDSLVSNDATPYSGSFLSRIPAQAWFILILAAFIGGSIWAVSGLMNSREELELTGNDRIETHDSSDAAGAHVHKTEHKPKSHSKPAPPAPPPRHALRPKVPPAPPRSQQPQVNSARNRPDTAREKLIMDGRDRGLERENRKPEDREDFRDDPNLRPVDQEYPEDESIPPDFYVEDGYEPAAGDDRGLRRPEAPELGHPDDAPPPLPADEEVYDDYYPEEDPYLHGN